MTVLLYFYGIVEKLLLVLELEMLYVDSLHLGDALLYRWLLKVLPVAKLTDCAGLLEFPLELLKSSLDIFSFFDRNDNHFSKSPPFSSKAGAKVYIFIFKTINFKTNLKWLSLRK